MEVTWLQANLNINHESVKFDGPISFDPNNNDPFPTKGQKALLFNMPFLHLWMGMYHEEAHVEVVHRQALPNVL